MTVVGFVSDREQLLEHGMGWDFAFRAPFDRRAMAAMIDTSE
jgi:hypothetical protein